MNLIREHFGADFSFHFFPSLLSFFGSSFAFHTHLLVYTRVRLAKYVKSCTRYVCLYACSRLLFDVYASHTLNNLQSKCASKHRLFWLSFIVIAPSSEQEDSIFSWIDYEHFFLAHRSSSFHRFMSIQIENLYARFFPLLFLLPMLPVLIASMSPNDIYIKNKCSVTTSTKLFFGFYRDKKRKEIQLVIDS